MNENIKLEEEKLLFIGEHAIQKIKKLNEIGIFTVSDFINAKTTTLLESKTYSYTKKVFVVYQQILQYKYRGQKMIKDVYLDREYHIFKADGWGEFLSSDTSNSSVKKIWEASINNALADLGFWQFLKKNGMDDPFLQFDQISMIDAIKQIAKLNPMYKPLSDFYVEYYEKEIKKEKTEELDVQNINSLKKEIVRLLIQKNELDSKINQLVEQVNALEGGSITNARK